MEKKDSQNYYNFTSSDFPNSQLRTNFSAMKSDKNDENPPEYVSKFDLNNSRNSRNSSKSKSKVNDSALKDNQNNISIEN